MVNVQSHINRLLSEIESDETEIRGLKDGSITGLDRTKIEILEKSIDRKIKILNIIN